MLVRKQKRKIPAVLVIFIILALTTFITFIIIKLGNPPKSNAVIISPLAQNSILSENIQKEAQQEQQEPTSLSTVSQNTSLSNLVLNNIKDKKGTYSVIIKNLTTGEEVQINENKQYSSASLYKLWVMATTFDQIRKGVIKEDQVLSAEISTLNSKFRIASEEAELTEGEINLTVNKALEQMITISHNYAALLLTSKVRLANVDNFLKSTNMLDSKIGSPPTTSAFDIALFFEKLYKGKIVDEKYSQKMLDLLSRQKLNDRIPKYLPKGVQIAHKTGELGEAKHDAGIVFSEKGDYIFIVLTQTPSPKDAAETTALLSKEVYNYFQKK